MSEALKHPSFEELYQQLRNLPQHQRGEILAGELVLSPRPAVPHISVGTELATDINYRFGRRGNPGGWLILIEPELHLVTPGYTHVVIPDLAGWKHETLAVLPHTAYLTTPPDWICEILSPATSRYDRREKARIYHMAGVTWRWIVDPDDQTIEAYRREGDFWILLGTWSDEEAAQIEPFEAASFDLRIWWERLNPPV
jgi:Uma2 family endonuclease